MVVGVVVGRFQVPYPHPGHQHILKTVSQSCDRVLLLLGVSPIDGRCANNPFSYHQRESVLHNWVQYAGLSNVTIMPLIDQRDDNDWCRTLDHLLDSLYPNAEVKLYHGRASGFVKCYTGHYSCVSVDSNGIEVSGREVRAAIEEKPSSEFMHGQAYALHMQYPHAYPTVDMAIIRPMTFEGHVSTPHVLIIQRADTGVWCFPGGFVDPTDGSLESAAHREAMEELGLAFNGMPHYISSRLQNDWRYRGSRDKIITTFFRLEYFAGPVRLKTDEVIDFKFVPVAKVEQYVSDVHAVLARDLVIYFHRLQASR